MNNGTRLYLLSALGLVALLPGCVRMTHQLEQSKPLEINVNVRLQIERELDEFFAFRDQNDATTQPASTQPITRAP
jgi:hypothetical protein